MESTDPARRTLDRRAVLRMAGLAGFGALSLPVLTACGADSPTNPAASTGAGTPTTASGPAASGSGAAAPADGPDPAAAAREGTLVVWHNDQEADVVTFLAAFTKKTGIAAVQQKIAPAEALTKLRLEQQAGVSDVDVFLASPDVHHQLVTAKLLLPYQNSIMSQYDPRYRSTEPGMWTAYFVNVCPMIYLPSKLPPAEAPKTYQDLLDPKWKDQLQFPGPTSATGYNWWYALKDLLPADYFDKLAAQKPTVFASSTAGIDEMALGNKKVAGSMSIFQYTKAKRRGEDLGFVADPLGIPTSLNSAAIIKGSKRPNAAKLYLDFLLSEEGQRLWNADLQGSYAALPNVTPPELPEQSTLKLLVATDMDDYGSAARRAEFEALWSKVVGLA